MLQIVGVLLALLLAGWPRMALANGGHIHIYTNLGIPYAVAWIMGGVGGLMLLWIIVLWAISYRRLQRERGGTAGPEPEPEEDGHGPEE